MKKKRNIRFTQKVMSIAIIWLWILLIFTLAGCAAVPTEQTGISSDRNVTHSTTAGEMEVHFIDVGQADATLITCGDNAMLIDAGDDASGTAVWNYLRKQGVEQLDYLILTHPHADHIGGADVILTKFDVDTVLMPDVTADTAAYRAVVQALDDYHVPTEEPKAGTAYVLGEAEFTILAPNHDAYGNDANNYSVGILLRHGENEFLFTGDAEEAAERDILKNGIDISCDVYKAGHHGSRTASSEEFMKAAAPKYAVISCGENNDYGHPHAEVLNRFRAKKIQVYRTDEQGSIVAVSDGSEITWNCAPTESWIAGEPKRAEESKWVLNLKTHKIHVPSCSSVAKIKQENIGYSSERIAELTAEGYAPCGSCKPTD